MNESFIQKEGVAMPRSEKANQRIREVVTAKILDGARKVFARKGMGATMAEIAAAAKVSQGLAYRYFANKEAIINALIEEGINSDPQFLTLREMPGTPGERLARLISGFLQARRESPEFFMLFYQMLSDETASESLREKISKRGLAIQGLFRQLIVEGQATGEIAQGDPDQLVTALMVYLDGLTRLAVYNPEQFSKHFPDAEIILRILKPPADQQSGPSQPTGEGATSQHTS
jgi:AcrR family transcriptional regulator